MRRSYFFSAVLLIGFVIVLPRLFTYSKNQEINQRVSNKKPAIHSASKKNPSSNRVEASQPKLKSFTEISREVERLKSSPSLAKYRKEARSNIHELPKSLDGVAQEVALSMERAKRDVAYAKTYFRKLATCAETKSEILTVRAVCAENAGRLARRYPSELAQKFDKLKERFDRKLQNLLW